MALIMDEVGWLYRQALETGVRRIADMGAFLAFSGLLSRNFLDASLDDSVQIDTWEQKEFRIFPAQRHIYNRIYSRDLYPDETYDQIFYFFSDRERMVSDAALQWGWSHGKRLFFFREFIMSEELYKCDFLDSIEGYTYKGEDFWSINIQKSLIQTMFELFNADQYEEAMILLKKYAGIVREDMTLLKLGIAVSSSIDEIEMMWKYVRYAYSIDSNDTELSELYSSIR